MEGSVRDSARLGRRRRVGIAVVEQAPRPLVGAVVGIRQLAEREDLADAFAQRADDDIDLTVEPRVPRVVTARLLDAAVSVLPVLPCELEVHRLRSTAGVRPDGGQLSED